MSENYGRGRGRRDEAGMSTQLTCFAIGATLGAVVALLLAPKSGRELREDLADATRKGVDRARETGAQLSTRPGARPTAKRSAAPRRRRSPKASPAPSRAGSLEIFDFQFLIFDSAGAPVESRPPTVGGRRSKIGDRKSKI